LEFSLGGILQEEGGECKKFWSVISTRRHEGTKEQEEEEEERKRKKAKILLQRESGEDILFWQ